MPATISCPSAANSGPRWSIVGIAIACNTRSGTLVGPGISRKWRPGWAGAVFFIAAGFLLFGWPSVGAKSDADKACDRALLRPPVSAGNLQALPLRTHPVLCRYG